ncbi:acyltransferase [Bradyrhizobium manausense]|uniref:acyltransferase family protein n=1 Tax=Bradyrhizobium manausense TaxID=989370 RepID=UPI001BA9FA17|nr:acyltransferase [Bradyrhizobium manausense]MBR0685321.1 acyltransferase [Bradyrhizobium manausense]
MPRSISAKAVPSNQFIPRLESLRGLAAVSVVGFHAYGMFHDTVVTGMAPVVLFFVLSGFVLSRSLERNPSAVRFFRNRVFRLLPAAAATVLLLSALHALFGFYVGFEASFAWTNVILNALLIKSDINGVMWSMTVECVASPLILVCFRLHKEYGPRPLVAMSIVLVGISSWGPYRDLLGGFTNLAPLYAFVIGVLLHFSSPIGDRPRFYIGRTAIAVTILLVCGLRKQTALTILGETAGAAVLIHLVALSDRDRIFEILDLALVRLIGQISYSFYLLHPIGLSLAARSGSRSSLVIFALALAYTIPMAWLSWRFIERPFVELGRYHTASRAGSFA